MSKQVTPPLEIGTNKDNVDWDVSGPPGAVEAIPGNNSIIIKPIGESETIGDIVITGTYEGDNGVETETIRITVVPQLQIAVDKDRNGVVSFGADDQTSSSSPHVFWANTDNDNGAIRRKNDLENGDLGSDNRVHWPDVEDTPSIVDGLGDLEDFDRLVIRGKKIYAQLLNSGYSLRLVQSNQKIPTKTIGISMSHKEPAELDYLTGDDHAFAERQIQNWISPNEDIINTPLIKRSIHADRFNSERVTFFFEGRAIRNKAVRVELVKTSVGSGSASAFAESNELHLDIRHIEQFYDIYSPAKKSGGNCDNTTTPYHQIGESDITLNQSKPWSLQNSDEYLLFVHGWRMRPEERRVSAETAFKRLFWLGYRGRVGLFSWPTDWFPEDDWIKFNGSGAYSQAINQKNYDRSERRAWHSAAALSKLCAKLESGQTNLSILAHSMGNIVASEALKLGSESGIKLADSYLASQAAVPSHAYDFNSNSSDSFYSDTNVPFSWLYLGSENPEIPNIYGQFPQNGNRPYFSTIALQGTECVNFYNRDDNALEFWLLNQRTKPDDFTDGIDDTAPGFYSYDFPSGLSQRAFLRTDLVVGGVPPVNPVLLVTSNRFQLYEIFSHIAEAKSFALGAYGNTSGPFGSRSVNTSTDAYGGFGDARLDHSGQFNRPLLRCHGYWKEVIKQAEFRTIGN